jgi:hypothetical protein
MEFFMRLRTCITFVAFISLCPPAFAISEALKKACDSDYLAYCSQHKVGTMALRSCMKTHRHMLGDTCIKAIGKSGEATQAEINDYKREKNLP